MSTDSYSTQFQFDSGRQANTKTRMHIGEALYTDNVGKHVNYYLVYAGLFVISKYIYTLYIYI